MKREARIRRRVSDIVRISIADGTYCFGRVLEEPLIAFYDCKMTIIPEVGSIISSPILFKIWVMNSAITSGRWEVIGNEVLDENTAAIPVFFKQDPINKKF